jgi:hypothetical protein
MVDLKKLSGMVAAGVLLCAVPALAKAPKKPNDYVITVTNNTASPVTAVSLTETLPVPAAAPAPSTDWWAAPMTWLSFGGSDKDAKPATRTVNVLKKSIEPKKSANVSLGASCKVVIAVSFEDGSSIDPSEQNFCKDKKLTLN